MSSNDKRFSWMIKPKGFIRLLGAEYDLLRKAGTNVLIKFYVSSILIFLIAIVSYLSISYAISLLFQNVIIELLFSLFLSLLLVIIYIFLINTFTKNICSRSIINASNIFRTGFVLFIAFIISKPVEIFVLKGKTDEAVMYYRQRLKDEHNEKIKQMFQVESKKLHEKLIKYSKFSNNSVFTVEVQDITRQLEKINERQQELLNSSELRINNGSFFIYRIKNVLQTPYSWIFCLTIIVLYLAPGYLIYSISRDDEYFKLKKTYENSIIDKAYTAFNKKYNFIFMEKYGLNIQFYTKFEDPPFNTSLKKDHHYKPSIDFLNKYSV